MKTTLSSYLKLGLQGGTGTGKSTTSALLLLGLSATYHDKAPVLVRDSEPGWDFLKPLFETEGVPLIIDTGRDFKGLHDSLRRAKKEGCCGFAVDSITHPWAELMERFADKTGRVPMHKFNQIRPLWNDFIVDFMDADLHCVASGRLTWEYITQPVEDEKTGKTSYEVIKGATKMKAGGSESFGYEPHLTCEMSGEQVRGANGKLKHMLYHCMVLKDRSRVLNGKEFSWVDIGADYRPGGYGKVLESFRPHVEFLRSLHGAPQKIGKQTSEAIVPGGDTDFYRDQKRKTAALEEWDALMELMFPGQSAAAKQSRAIVGRDVTGVLSRTRMEQFEMKELQWCVDVLASLEKRLKIDRFSTPEELSAIIEMAKEDCRNGQSKDRTLLQQQLEQSVAQAQAPIKTSIEDDGTLPFLR